jgi:transposase
MAKALMKQDSGSERVLHLALELSNSRWRLCFSDGEKLRHKGMDAGDLAALDRELTAARERFSLGSDCRVVGVYEAGRDGFWIQRALQARGIECLVVDSASIEVNRRQRRVKTDRVDVEALVRLLVRYLTGESKALAVLRVPSPEQEDLRRIHRERERLIQERGVHRVRIQSLLVAQGVRRKVDGELLAELEGLSSPAGYPLGEELKAEIPREYARYCLVHEQVLVLEREQRRRVEEASGGALKQVKQLRQLRGVGWVSAWVLVMEFLSWRGFANRKELAACAGLSPSPYNSGESVREQGISKAGSRRVRTLMVELAWLWLRYQPGSTLSKWYRQRFAEGGKRMRRIGIVALARKLLVVLWRYLKHGELPAGVVLAA